MLNSSVPRDSEEVIIKRILRRVDRYFSEIEKSQELRGGAETDSTVQFRMGEDNTATKIGGSNENTMPGYKAPEKVVEEGKAAEQEKAPKEVASPPPIPVQAKASPPPPPPPQAEAKAKAPPALPMQAKPPPAAQPPPPAAQPVPQPRKAEVPLKPDQKAVKLRRDESKHSPDSAIDNLFMESQRNKPADGRSVSLVWILLGIVVFLVFVLALLLMRNSSFTY